MCPTAAYTVHTLSALYVLHCGATDASEHRAQSKVVQSFARKHIFKCILQDHFLNISIPFYSKNHTILVLFMGVKAHVLVDLFHGQ